MTVRVAINGFGRIGRLVLRAIVESRRRDIVVVGVKRPRPVNTNAHLLRYDSVHGRFPGAVTVDGEHMIVDGHKIRVTAIKDPAQLPHKELGVDIALECTGIFAAKEKCSTHLAAGAKRVLISAPADGVDRTVVYGVNHQKLTPDDIVVSNASCTTNCLAPVAMVMHEAVGIAQGFMTTIHSYTNDQPVLDQPAQGPLSRPRRGALHNSNLDRRGEGCRPGIAGAESRLDGVAVRVPTPNVSLVDFKFTAKRVTTVEEINGAAKAAAADRLKGILDIVEAPLVSSDFNHNPASSSFAVDQTKVIDGTFVRVMAWYDNEWGFSNRMADVAVAMGALL